MHTAMHGHTGARAHYMHTLHPLGEQVQALRVMHAVDTLHAPSGIFFAWMSQQRSPKAAPAAAKRTPKTAGTGKERARGGGAARSTLPDGLCYKRWDELMRVGAPHAARTHGSPGGTNSTTAGPVPCECPLAVAQPQPHVQRAARQHGTVAGAEACADGTVDLEGPHYYVSTLRVLAAACQPQSAVSAARNAIRQPPMPR